MHQFFTERLRCRLIEANDSDFVKGLYASTSRLEYLQAVLGDVCIDRIFDTIIRQNSSTSESFYWLIEDKNNQEPLGIQSITALKDLLSVFEFGIILAANAEGKGYAYEALLGMIDYAFTILDHDILVETHQANNLSVCKLAERLGLNHAATFNHNQIEHCMTIKLKKDWSLEDK
jgi:RimJ/RimL family protein N-acetyltransferase